MAGLAYRWHRQRCVSACLRDRRSATGSRSGLRYQAMRSAPGLVMFAAPAESRCRTFSSSAASFSPETDSHCCRSPSSCPDRPPPAPVVLGRVHGDPVIQLDDFPVAPRGGSALDSGDPGGCLRLCDSQLQGSPGPTAGRLRRFCGILKIEAGACSSLASSLPAFPQAGGLTQEVWDGAGERIRTADRPLTRRIRLVVECR
jgi:hypothetical protein